MASDGSITIDTQMDTSGISTGTSAICGFANAGKLAVTAAIAACVAGLASFVKSTIETGSQFDAAMSQLAATMGTTGDQIEDLRDKAKEMGKSTAFTATEAAEGLNILAMAGYNATEQCEMIEPVLNLASAGATTMDNAASYLATTLKGYCVTSEETGEMTQYYSDLMAKGATLVNTSVDELGEAMSRSSATANGYGQTVETTTTALLALADGGITGGQAATYLSRMMTNLYAPTSSAKAAMEELSDQTGVNCRAYDETTGETRDFIEVVESLKEATAQLSDEEANNYIKTIMGQIGLKGYNVIANKSSEEIEELTANLTDCSGAAQQMADTQLDNLQGDMTLLNSAVDGLKIQLFETMDGPLRSIVQFITNSVIPVIEVILDHMPLIISLLAGIAAGVTTYMIATNAETIALYAMEAAEWIVTTATEVMGAAMDAIPFVALAAGVAAAVTVLVKLVQKFRNTDSEARDLKNELKDLEDQMEENNQTYEETCEENEMTAAKYAQMADELDNLTSRTELTRAEQERMNAIIAEFQEQGLDLTYDEIAEATDGSSEAVHNFCDALAEEAEYNAAVQEYNDLMDQRAEIEKVATDAEIIMNGETEANWQQMRQASQTYKDATADLEELDAQIEELDVQIEECGQTMDETNGVMSETDGAIVQLVDDLATQLSDLSESYQDVYDAAYDSMTGQFDLWEEAAEVSISSMDDLQAALDSQKQYWEDLSKNIEILSNSGIDGMDQLLASIDTTSTDGASYIASLAAAVQDGSYDMQAYVAEATEGLSGSWQAAATSVADSTTNYSQSVEQAMQNCITQINQLDQGSEAHELAVNTLAGYIGGLDDSEEDVDEEVVSVAEELVNKFAEELEIGSPSKVFEEFGQNTSDGFIIGMSNMSADVDAKLTETTSVLQKWGSDVDSETEQAGKNASENVTSGFSQIPGNVQTNTNSTLKNVKSWAKDTISETKDMGSNVISHVKDYFSQVPTEVGNDTGSTLKSFMSFGSDVANEAQSAGSNVLNHMTDAFVNMATNVSGKLNDIARDAANWGSQLSTSFNNMGVNVMQGMINGIGSMVGNLYESIRGALSGLVDKAKGALGISSPSTIFAEEVGAWIPPGIEEGLDDAMPELLNTTEKDMEAMVSRMQASVDVNAGKITTISAARAAYNSARDGSRFATAEATERPIDISGEIHTYVELDKKIVGNSVTPIVDKNFAHTDNLLKRGG